jgi:hypothetical protein
MDSIMSKFRSHSVSRKPTDWKSIYLLDILQAAAQQHELTLTRHYEQLLLARDSASMQSDLSSNVGINASLQQLSENLHGLLRSIAGEDPSSAHGEANSLELEESEQLLDRLLDNREDWAIERESEIARLEEENETLRKMLGIDHNTAEEKGWLEVEAREQLTSTRCILPSHPSRSSSPVQGGAGPSPSVSPFVSLPSMPAPPGQPRTQDNMVSMRVAQGRRTGIFGQRGRGGGPGGWEGGGHPPVPDKPWQAPVGLDLS